MEDQRFKLKRLSKKNKLRVYYLSWLRNKILHNDPEVEKKQGWVTVGDLEGCVHYKVACLCPACLCPACLCLACLCPACLLLPVSSLPASSLPVSSWLYILN
ncbi:hypothetical protein CRUP_014772 [Coryphaenoides rupestris]|nr:hypothetical protein CRUP_014772 [Coryphaenoides rupestris]